MSASQRLPPLPSVRKIAAELKSLHEAFAHPIAGGDAVVLLCECLGNVAPYYEWRVYAAAQIDSVWIAHEDDGGRCCYGWEEIPGDGARFDAQAAARRLLSDARIVRSEP